MNPISQEKPYKQFLESKADNNQTRTGYAAALAVLRKKLGCELLEADKFKLEWFISDCRDRGLKGATSAYYKAVISSFFIWAVEHELLKEAPTKLMLQVDTGARSSANPKALNKEQRQRVLDCLIWEGTLLDYKMSLAILMGFYEGFRRFEIAKLQWDEIELEKNRIKVLGKGRKLDQEPDYVPLSAFLKEKLKDFREMTDKAKVDSRWVFFHPDDPHKHYPKESVARWFKVIGKRAGFNKSIKFSSHSGRHIFCTSLNEGELAPIDAIKMTRHKSVDMYASKYVKIEEAETQAKFKKVIP